MEEYNEIAINDTVFIKNITENSCKDENNINEKSIFTHDNHQNNLSHISNIHHEKLISQNNIKESLHRSMDNARDSNPTFPNSESYLPNYHHYNPHLIGKNFVNNFHVEPNVNNSTRTANKFYSFPEKLQKQFIYNYNNNINILNNNIKQLTSHNLLKNINNFYSNAGMIAKLPPQMENMINGPKIEVNYKNLVTNKVKSGKKSKKQHQTDNNKHACKGLDDDHNRINLENVSIKLI
jgi:hypothetical protein